MKLGMDFPKEWKTWNEKSGMAISDILYGYAVEDFMFRLERSSLHEHMWMMNEEAFSQEAFCKKVKDSLCFYYKAPARKVCNRGMIEEMMSEIKDQDRHGIFWTDEIEEKGNMFLLHLEAHYKDMLVPVTVTIEEAPENALSPKTKSRDLVYVSKKVCKYYSYSKECILAEALFEMLRKLELVADMSVYSVANSILQQHSISGRHIIEEFKYLGDKEPKVISLRRLQQIDGYRTYAYMEKKWQQYEKRQGREPEEWSVVLDRIMKFLTPVWTALCENEIFFDDWMPELERFLD